MTKTLTKHEVERLLGALTHDGPAALRTAAIVHCALDLGLRSSEIAYLGLDDIDWIPVSGGDERCRANDRDPGLSQR